MTNPIFTAGTTKGGTTFFTRLMSVNKEIKIASDAYLSIFRSFRTNILRNNYHPDFNERLPLDDFYYSEQKLEQMRIIQESDLSLPFPHAEREQLIAQLKARVPLGAKELLPYIDELSGKNYQELFESALQLLHRAYGIENIKWCGFNDNWVIEFFPVLARAFPTAKFIGIVRDPRAAMASSIKLREKEPELVPLMYSFAHSWRKHIAFTRKFLSMSELKDRFMVVKYEDLASNPEPTTQKLCEFMDVEYDPKMLDTNKFRAYRGDKWTNYSNFNVPEQGIYKDAVTKWKSFLDKKTIEFIEYICDPDMRVYGYKPEVYGGGFPSNNVIQFLIEDDKTAAGWRIPHESWDKEIGYELFRKLATKCEKGLLSTEIIKKYFLFEIVYNELKTIIS